MDRHFHGHSSRVTCGICMRIRAVLQSSSRPSDSSYFFDACSCLQVARQCADHFIRNKSGFARLSWREWQSSRHIKIKRSCVSLQQLFHYAAQISGVRGMIQKTSHDEAYAMDSKRSIDSTHVFKFTRIFRSASVSLHVFLLRRGQCGLVSWHQRASIFELDGVGFFLLPCRVHLGACLINSE